MAEPDRPLTKALSSLGPVAPGLSPVDVRLPDAGASSAAAPRPDGRGALAPPEPAEGRLGGEAATGGRARPGDGAPGRYSAGLLARAGRGEGTPPRMAPGGGVGTRGAGAGCGDAWPAPLPCAPLPAAATKASATGPGSGGSERLRVDRRYRRATMKLVRVLATARFRLAAARGDLEAGEGMPGGVDLPESVTMVASSWSA
mmetsp:Transcript_4982/g.14713  ORF Transcript_4982/g.14713 Transcript_4982/m.14713 type:complete len:201 (-) Transcript_4982:1391-1993(-)